MLKLFCGLVTGTLLTLAGLALAASVKDKEPVSSVDESDAENLKAAVVLRVRVEDIERREKAQLDALREVLRKQREVATATATASETAAEPVSDSPADNAESC